MNIITGGGGFIGLNLVEILLKKGEQVLICDNMSEGYNDDGVNHLKDKYSTLLTFMYCDVAKHFNFSGNYEFLNIYHLAAQSHVDRSIADPMSFIVNNVIGTANVLEYYRNNPKNTKLLVVSTDEVYGDEGPFPTKWDAPIRTSSPYSASKASADLLVEAYRRTYGLPIKLSRCCNNFGTYQNKEKFIPTIINSIKSDKFIPVYGDGLQMRQWVPAEVHTSRLIELMEGNDLNMLVGGVSLTNMNLIQTIAKITETNCGKSVIIKHIEDRVGHDKKYELYDEKSINKEQFSKYLEKYILEEIT